MQLPCQSCSRYVAVRIVWECWSHGTKVRGLGGWWSASRVDPKADCLVRVSQAMRRRWRHLVSEAHDAVVAEAVVAAVLTAAVWWLRRRSRQKSWRLALMKTLTGPLFLKLCGGDVLRPRQRACMSSRYEVTE